MKTKIIAFIVTIVISSRAVAQGVGINIDTPQAMLHVGGTVRIDSFKPPLGVCVALMIDSVGNVVKDEVYNGQTIPLVYGESISAGELVTVGDGTTGYLSAEQKNSPYTQFNVPMGELVAQSFVTSPQALGIRAIVFRAGISTQVTFTMKLRRCVNGLPSGLDIATATYTGQGTNTSVDVTMVFDPPAQVMPNTSYVFIIDFQKTGGTSTTTNSYSYSAGNNLYTDGTRLYSSNGGLTWISYANQDMVFCVYETQTQNSRVYKAISVQGGSAILDGNNNKSYAAVYEDHRGVGDRLDNIIGVAAQSGSAGEMKQVYVGNPCSGFSGLIPGSTYYRATTPGQVNTTGAVGFIDRKVGFAVTDQKMFLEK